MDEELKEQTNSRPWLFKKGQSGNPKGRPPGKSIKERAKAMLAHMTDDEFEDFLHGLDKKIIWEMAEGKPDTKTDITTMGEKLETQANLDLDALAEKMASKLKEEKI